MNPIRSSQAMQWLVRLPTIQKGRLGYTKSSFRWDMRLRDQRTQMPVIDGFDNPVSYSIPQFP